jgi:flagellar biosynthesis/type III secretory pathway chaperone
MIASLQADHADEILTRDVLAHLDEQLVAARQLLGIVLEQGAAIRRRDVQNVVRLAGLLQAEFQRRALLDEQRSAILERAGARLGVGPGSVSITLLEGVMEPEAAVEAHTRSSELRGLLDELKREHTVNRALMSQELAFLDHLLRLAEGDSRVGYDADGDHREITTSVKSGRRRVLDLEA